VKGDPSPVVVVSPPSTVIDHDGSVPPTHGAPTVVGVIPEPGNPARRPAIPGDPTPVIKRVPVPSAIVVGEETP